MRRFIFIFLAAAFGLILLNSFTSERDKENSFVPKSIKKSLLGIVGTIVRSSPNSTDTTVVGSSPVASGSLNVGMTENVFKNIPELQDWIDLEAPKMDSTRNDTKDDQIKLRAIARALTEEHVVYLKSVAIDLKSPINNRILSGFMITQNPAPSSVEGMFDIAKSAVPDFGPVLPHSEAEVKHSQEMAIRYMQVDELANRAKTDSNARDKLKLLSETAEDEQVRNYAARKLKDS